LLSYKSAIPLEAGQAARMMKRITEAGYIKKLKVKIKKVANSNE